MLDPRDRYLLLDAFRPPDGYAFDAGIGTSFTLDLEALLLAPLALAAFDAEAHGDEVTADPIALLEATRRLADRLTFFTSAGRISVPRHYLPALCWLEDSIVEVNLGRARGVFHPKLWLLRFQASEGDIARYRLIATSRNVTFDRSWDTLVCLEGAPRQEASGPSDQGADQLAKLIRDLPRLAVGGIAKERTNLLARLAKDLERTEFQSPPGTRQPRFFVMRGGRDDTWPFQDEVSSILVVAPFVTPDLLDRLPSTNRRRLVSRPETIDAIGADALTGWDTYVISAAAAGNGDVSAGRETESQNGAQPIDTEDPAAELAGLHAKVFVLATGRQARLLTGSANATTAAFGHNVEFLVQLEGSTSTLGPEAIWGDASGGLAAITEPYTPPAKPVLPPEDLEAERQLDGVLADIASLEWQIFVEATDEELYDLRIETTGALPSDIEAVARCWLLSVGPGRSFAIKSGRPANGAVRAVALETISPYLVIELTQGNVRARSVVNADLFGDPPNRRQRVLSNALGSPEEVLRYMLFLLSGLGDDVLVEVARRLAGRGSAGDGEPEISVPLFEALIRALSRDPARIDIVQRLVDDLSAAEDGKDLLPAGFREIWRPICEARGTQTK